MQSIQQLLQSVERRDQFQSRRHFQRLLAHWPSLVGEMVATHTRPTSIHRDRLNVATASAAWAQNLTFERRRLLRKIKDQLDLDLIDIRFTTAQWTVGTPSAPPTPIHTLWLEHPSRWDLAPESAAAAPQPQSPDTPLDAFERWAAGVQQQTINSRLCPQCQAPTPTGELDRWQCCALCVTRQWSSTR